MSEKSFLRWAGSKQKLIPQLKSYWRPEFERYLEPFMGSAQLFFAISPQKAILSDLNYELVEVYKQIQRNPYPVHLILKSMKVSENEYYKIRAIDPSTLGINQRTARFIYLNRLCFNGLYRTNLKGEFNVPFSGSKLKSINDYTFFKTISNQLSNVKIISGDFEKIIIKNVKKGDFIYLDPPFAVENRRIFKQYGPQTFGLDDLRRLKICIEYIENTGAHFLLSYAYCKEALDIFSDWEIKKTFTQRNIAGFSTFRRKAAEILVTNVAF